MKSRYEAPQTYNARRHNMSNSGEASGTKKIAGKAIVITALLVAGVGGAIGMNMKLSHDALAGQSKPSGELVETTTKMKIGSGAILRSSPNVPDPDISLSNKLGSLDFGDTENTVIDTPHGVYIHDDVNGRWYGIDRDDLKESSIKNSSAKLDTDRDGVIWVNEQRADPEE